MNCPYCSEWNTVKRPKQVHLQHITYDEGEYGDKYMCMRCSCTYEFRNTSKNFVWLYNENINKYAYAIEEKGYHIVPTRHFVPDRKTRNGILIEVIDRNKILREQDYRCVYCGIDLRITEKHLDHIVPIAKGGAEIQENMQYLCRDCNIKKKDTISKEWNNVELYESMKRRGLLHYHIKHLK